MSDITEDDALGMAIVGVIEDEADVGWPVAARITAAVVEAIRAQFDVTPKRPETLGDRYQGSLTFTRSPQAIDVELEQDWRARHQA